MGEQGPSLTHKRHDVFRAPVEVVRALVVKSGSRFVVFKE
jgi:hypothetical protein